MPDPAELPDPLTLPDPDAPDLTDAQREERTLAREAARAARDDRANAIKNVSKIPTDAAGAPNFGDMTRFKEWPDANIDVLCGGTPCQSYSVAGLREGLDDPRGNLTLTFAGVARKYRPTWLGWENVPGVLSSNGGRDFASFLGLLSGQNIIVPPTGWCNAGVVPGIKSAYGLAWRVLDAQFAGVPQRRRRVWVVGYLGDWRPAAAVLLERESLLGNPPPRRESRKGAPRNAASSPGASGVVGTLESRHAGGFQSTDSAARGHLIPEISAPLSTGSNAAGGGRAPGTSPDEAPSSLVVCADVSPTLAGAGNKTGGDRPFGTQVESAESLVVTGAISGQTAKGGMSGQEPEHLIVMSSGQANAEIVKDVSPSLTCLHEAPILAFDETQITSPQNGSNPKPGDPSPPLAKGARPPTIAFNANSGSRHGDVLEELSPPIKNGDHGGTPAIAFSCKDAGADAATDLAPTLRTMGHENSHSNGGGQLAVAVDTYNQAINGDLAHSIRAGAGPEGVPAVIDAVAIDFEQGLAPNGSMKGSEVAPPLTCHADQHTAIAFKASHFTRGKDGAPSEVAPPLSADADRGDQDTVIAIQGTATRENPASGPDGVGVRTDDMAYTLEARAEVQAVAFESRFVRNGRGAPSDIVPPLKAQSGETGKGDAAPLVAMGFEARYFSREGTGGAPAETVQLNATGAEKAGDAAPLVMQFEPRHFTRGQGPGPSDVAPALKHHATGGRTGSDSEPVVFTEQSFKTETSPTLVGGENGGGKNAINLPHVASTMQVRRLTPMECERLMSMRDGYTLIDYKGKPAADGPRYKALGNSWVVNEARWIGQRIMLVEEILREAKA